MSDFLLTQVINFGTPFIGIILLLGALGLPVGASVVVIAAGAFSQQGVLNWYEVIIIGLVCAVLGDMLSYGMGYYAKGWVEKRFGNSPAWVNASNSFQKQAGLAIYLTRWLVTAIAIPTNWIAGGSGYKFSRFLFYDVSGELTWLLVYGGLGYWFGSQWELVYDFINNFGGLVLGVVFFGFGLRMAWNWREKKRLAVESEPA
ncbi:MAG: VTT domain-containing protein [Chloroflexi bacterium]|nr:VTT domain-containing protein [Chloroflexota bacterium]